MVFFLSLFLRTSGDEVFLALPSDLSWGLDAFIHSLFLSPNQLISVTNIFESKPATSYDSTLFTPRSKKGTVPKKP